jgi:hypothetical protein
MRSWFALENKNVAIWRSLPEVIEGSVIRKPQFQVRAWKGFDANYG